jgi:hypothetical protein
VVSHYWCTVTPLFFARRFLHFCKKVINWHTFIFTDCWTTYRVIQSESSKESGIQRGCSFNNWSPCVGRSSVHISARGLRDFSAFHCFSQFGF